MRFMWNEEKNELLKKQRNISFEEIVEILENNRNSILDVIDNPKHHGEWIYILSLSEKYFVYLVQFLVLNDGSIFLKTIYPSRKDTKNYK